LKRFCIRRNETIKLKPLGSSLICLPYGGEAECAEARCKYSVRATMSAPLFSPVGPEFPDYTTELKEAPANKVTKAKGPSKICDICSKPVYRQDAYLFDTGTILASDEYIDFIIRGWVKKGLFPSSAISGGINSQIRALTREDVRRQAGGTPWLVCKSCLSMFSVKEKDLEKAKNRADQFWK